MQTLYSLQILRAIASLFVVYLHLGQSLSFGNFGVDIFFVLSGFVMAMVVQKQRTSYEFITGRIARIVPMYWFMCLVLLAYVTVDVNHSHWFSHDINFFFKSLFFIPSFNQNGELYPFYGAGWTLFYEILFYCYVAVFIYAFKKYYNPEKIIKYVAILLVYVILITHYLPKGSAVIAFLSDSVILEFLFGFFAYAFTQKYQGFKGQKKWLYLPIALSLIVFMAVFELASREFRFLIIGLPACIFVIIAVQLEDSVIKMPEILRNFAVKIGDASYTIYLINMFVIAVFRKIIGAKLPIFDPTTYFGGLITFIACIVIGLIMHRFIEKPLTDLARAFFKSLRHPYFLQKV